jgi:Xaa-Pro aminopeptidase
MRYPGRLTALRERFTDRGVESFLIATREDIRYFSGFSGTSGLLLVSREDATLLTDFRYQEQSRLEVGDMPVRIAERQPTEELVRMERAAFGRALGFDPTGVSHRFYSALRTGLSGVSLVPVESALGELTAVKDAEEIERIARAVQIGDAVFDSVVTELVPGVSERDIVAEIDYRLMRTGAEGSSFDTIVAAGNRSSMPHARPTDAKLAEGDLVILDFGAFYEGYASDMTRTLSLGKPDAKQQAVYDIVLEAQVRAIGAATAGMRCCDLDGVARSTIAEAGYGEAFGHSLGHGVGLRIHDGPHLSRTNEAALVEGMVVTIEPGIYLSGWGGVRIEDLVVIESDGARDLTKSPKGLQPLLDPARPQAHS